MGCGGGGIHCDFFSWHSEFPVSPLTEDIMRTGLQQLRITCLKDSLLLHKTYIYWVSELHILQSYSVLEEKHVNTGAWLIHWVTWSSISELFWLSKFKEWHKRDSLKCCHKTSQWTLCNYLISLSVGACPVCKSTDYPNALISDFKIFKAANIHL